MTPIDPITLLNMAESETFDFKSGQYTFYGGATDEEKGELLKDILAFANAFKAGDAFIVIGVVEKDSRKDSVVGVSDVLKDNDVQQFVNSKTNNPVKFLAYADTAEGQTVNIIQIAQAQERPIYLKQKYGRLKPDEVYIRSGSTTTIATPAQIAQMVRADHQISLAQARLNVEWAAADGRTRFGKEARIECVNLITPPQPEGRHPEPRVMMERALRAVSIRSDADKRHQPLSTVDRELLPTGDYADYIKARAMLVPLRIFIQNVGAKNAASVNAKIRILKAPGVKVIDESDFPQKPRNPSFIRAPLVLPMMHDTFVKEAADVWIVQVDAKTIQPQDEFWSDDNFYVSVESDQVIAAHVRIFADDLAKPIEIPLTISAKVVSREITMADLEFDDD